MKPLECLCGGNCVPICRRLWMLSSTLCSIPWVGVECTYHRTYWLIYSDMILLRGPAWVYIGYISTPCFLSASSPWQLLLPRIWRYTSGTLLLARSDVTVPLIAYDQDREPKNLVFWFHFNGPLIDHCDPTAQNSQLLKSIPWGKRSKRIRCVPTATSI